MGSNESLPKSRHFVLLTRSISSRFACSQKESLVYFFLPQQVLLVLCITYREILSFEFWLLKLTEVTSNQESVS